MPWALLEFPSIALGILSSVLKGADIAPIVRSYNLLFVDFVQRREGAGAELMSLQDYRDLANLSPGRGLGDWIFAVPPFRPISPEEDERYFELLHRNSSLSRELTDKARRLRDLIPAFIDVCVDDVLQHDPALVGFSTTFNQNVSSLLLARRIKDRLRRGQLRREHGPGAVQVVPVGGRGGPG
jgi:hypothetical protein